MDKQDRQIEKHKHAQRHRETNRQIQMDKRTDKRQTYLQRIEKQTDLLSPTMRIGWWALNETWLSRAFFRGTTGWELEEKQIFIETINFPKIVRDVEKQVFI
jgi:hypothetical protein